MEHKGHDPTDQAKSECGIGPLYRTVRTMIALVFHAFRNVFKTQPVHLICVLVFSSGATPSCLGKECLYPCNEPLIHGGENGDASQPCLVPFIPVVLIVIVVFIVILVLIVEDFEIRNGDDFGPVFPPRYRARGLDF